VKKNMLTRRAFLAATTTTATAALAGCATTTNTAQVVPGKVSPNEKLNIAGIGVGGKGKDDIFSCRRENIVALCDVDWEQAGEAFSLISVSYSTKRRISTERLSVRLITPTLRPASWR